MKGRYLITGVLFLILASVGGVEYLATMVSTDGSVMIASSESDDQGSAASRAMAVDSVRLSRTISGNGGMGSDLSVKSSGPVLFAEYASNLLQKSELKELCAFLNNSGDQDSRESSQYATGILRNGEYGSSLTRGPDLNALTQVNGSGMIVFGSQSQNNCSLQSRGFVTGNMTVNDLVRYGV